MIPLAFDLLFCAALIGLAVSALRARETFTSIILFVLFGLLVALAWARLGAPDLALTEAALGAGLVGALFLAVLYRVGPEAVRAAARRGGRRHAAARPAVLLVAALVLYTTWSGLIQLEWRAPGGGLTRSAYAALDRSGVTNPVTAALLNYRAYDTLLELAVLMLVVLSMYALHPPRPGRAGSGDAPDEVLAGYGRAAGPTILVVAGYVLWAGSHRPGGAFQAGSILAGAGVLLMLSGGRSLLDFNRLRTRVAIVAGFTAFAATGLLLLSQGMSFLEWPPAAAKKIIVTIETVATLSIAFTLVLLFAGCAGRLIPAAAREEERS